MVVILGLVVAVFLAGSLAVLLAVFAAGFVALLLTVFVTVPLAVFVAVFPVVPAVVLVSPDHAHPSRLLRLSPVGSRRSAMFAYQALTTAQTFATDAHAGWLAFASSFGYHEQDLRG